MKGRIWFLVITLLAIVVALSWGTVNEFIMKIIYPLEYKETILIYTEEYGVDSYLIMGLIKAESNFVPDAHSKQDAKGLMQLTDATAEWVAGELGEDYSFDKLVQPEYNIKLGTWYLSYLLKSYEGDITLALCAYNAGSGNLGKWLKNPDYSPDGQTIVKIPFPETRKYVENTVKYAKVYREFYKD